MNTKFKMILTASILIISSNTKAVTLDIKTFSDFNPNEVFSTHLPYPSPGMTQQMRLNTVVECKLRSDVIRYSNPNFPSQRFKIPNHAMIQIRWSDTHQAMRAYLWFTRIFSFYRELEGNYILGLDSGIKIGSVVLGETATVTFADGSSLWQDLAACVSSAPTTKPITSVAYSVQNEDPTNIRLDQHGQVIRSVIPNKTFPNLLGDEHLPLLLDMAQRLGIVPQ